VQTGTVPTINYTQPSTTNASISITATITNIDGFIITGLESGFVA